MNTERAKQARLALAEEITVRFPWKVGCGTGTALMAKLRSSCPVKILNSIYIIKWDWSHVLRNQLTPDVD
jgi:hypothetical protein